MSRDTFNFRYFTTSLRLLIVLLAMMALPMGCAKVQPEPFVKFAEGIELASAAIDKASADYSAQYRQRFLREQSENLESNTLKLLLTVKGDFDVSYNFLSNDTKMRWLNGLVQQKKLSDIAKEENNSNINPVVLGFILAQTMENVLSELNKAFTGYALALVGLSKYQMIDLEIAAIGKAFEGPFAEILKMAPGSINSEVANGASALLASAFATAIQAKQVHSLIKGIERAQPMVVAYSRACKQSLSIQATIFKQVYIEQFTILSNEYAMDTNKASRQLKMAKILNLNEELIRTMKVIETLSEYYSILPQAHAGLAKWIALGFSWTPTWTYGTDVWIALGFSWTPTWTYGTDVLEVSDGQRIDRPEAVLGQAQGAGRTQASSR